jgi:Flp pilus assembly protein TadG
MPSLCFKKIKSKNHKGSALIEFALVMPVFLTILLATYELGLMLTIKNGLFEGLYTGSRIGITGNIPPGSGFPSLAVAVSTTINNNFKLFSAGTLGNLTVTINNYSSLSNLLANTSPVSGVGGTGRYVLYSASYTYNTITPMLRPIFGNSVVITESISVRNELY